MFKFTPKQLIEIIRICAKCFQNTVSNSYKEYEDDCKQKISEYYQNPNLFL